MRTTRHQPDYILFIAVLMLTGIGIVTVYSASSVILLHSGGSADHMAIRQLLASVAGLILFGLVTYWPYQNWYKQASRLLIVSVLLLLVVLAPGIGHRALGATRWLGTTSVHVQPSAIAVVAIVIYLSFLLTKKMTVLHDTKRAFRPAIIVILLLSMLVLVEPDMGTAMALLGTSLVLLFASGIRLKPLMITTVLLIPLGYLAIKAESYRGGRISGFLHPFAASSRAGDGYQLIQGLTAIANGGLTGRGFDLSVMATGYLPESWTDFIFAVFTEQWGWLGDAGLLAIFAVVIWRGFRIARYAPDRFGSLLAIGLTSSIIIQAAINLGAVTWLIPVTGIPLPFISYGGTAIVLNLFAMGILMSVSRETGDSVPEADTVAEVYSVEEFRAQRTQNDSLFAGAGFGGSTKKARSNSGQTAKRAQKSAPVANLSAHKGGSWKSQSNTRSRDAGKTSNEQRRNLSLSWRTAQTQGDAWNKRTPNSKNAGSKTKGTRRKDNR